MPNLIDMIGFTSGRLTVIERALTKNGKTARWRCQCECGKYKDIDGTKLRRKEVLSCGCLQKEKVLEVNQNKLIDLTKQTFGKLTVLKRGDNVGVQPTWICQCECGNIVQVMGSNLRRENGTRSCGCEHAKGELLIRQILSQANISYQTEYVFDDCLSDLGNKLRFDICVFNPDGSISHLIEYQGRQHYEETNFFSSNLEHQQLLDDIKRKYCQLHQIPLIEIPYWDYDNINLDMLLNYERKEK